ncbi:MAG: hypothetical protein MUF72_19650 [Elainella sp. Prado103]|jgi:Ca2+-binding RTX toxin-like protein|nr:hypothetical protein [Elainella sp. Prado103]
MSANSNSDFPVNTYVSGRQENPDIAVDPLGNFVITWQSFGQDGDGFGVFARSYNASADPLGSEFLVNTITSGDQFTPAVAIDSGGNFVVVWTSEGRGFSGEDVYGQRFDANTGLIGSEFKINLTTQQDQSNPDVAIDAVGNFVVVYESEFQDNNTNGRDGDGSGIFLQRFNRAGAIVGREERVNTITDRDQTTPVVAMNGLGEFVVVWNSDRQDGSSSGLFGQRYNSAGIAIGREFQVNTTTRGRQLNPSVAIDDSGGFVVSWQGENGRDDDGYGVYARRYSPNGSPIGGEILVNSTIAGDQIEPAVAIDSAGHFTVIWVAEDGDSSGSGILGQRFDNDGRKSGDEFRVNSTQRGDQTQPAIGLTPVADYVATWQDRPDRDRNIRASTTAAKNIIRGDRRDNFLPGTNQGDRILGLQGSDTLRGVSGNDVLEGNQGSDFLEGGNGDDFLSGGTNGDQLDGGNGNDTLVGGSGLDTFVLRSKQGSTLITDFTPGGDLLGLASGIKRQDVRLSSDGDNTLVIWRGLELATLFGVNAQEITPDDFVSISRSGRQITGTSKNDRLTGTGGSDEIDGRGGNDTIDGRAGDDLLFGSEGNDSLTGGNGNDSLTGGNGNDRLVGGDGDDFLDAGNGEDEVTGGQGKDIFVLNLKTGRTVITDFQDGIDALSIDRSLKPRDLEAEQDGADTLIIWQDQELAVLKNISADLISFNASDLV